MHDLHNNIKTTVGVAPVAAGTTGTGQVGGIIDTQGYGGVEFVIDYGAITSSAATFTVLVKEGDVTGTMTSVADANLLGTEALAGIGAAARVDGSTENVSKRIGYKGGKRYAQCGVVNTATAGTPIAVTAVLHSPNVVPTANP